MTSIEERLQGLFSSVLLSDSVTRDTDFFQIGDSVKALRLVAEAEKALGVPLPMWALYKYRTIATLADYFASAGAVQPQAGEGPTAGGDYDTGVI